MNLLSFFLDVNIASIFANMNTFFVAIVVVAIFQLTHGSKNQKFLVHLVLFDICIYIVPCSSNPCNQVPGLYDEAAGYCCYSIPPANTDSVCICPNNIPPVINGPCRKKLIIRWFCIYFVKNRYWCNNKSIGLQSNMC